MNDDTNSGMTGKRPVTFIKIHGKQMMNEL